MRGILLKFLTIPGDTRYEANPSLPPTIPRDIRYEENPS